MNRVRSLRKLAGVTPVLWMVGAVWAETVPTPFVAVGETDGVVRLAWEESEVAGLGSVGESLTITDFPLSLDRTVDLEVERFDVFTPDAKVVVGSADGDREVERPDVALWRGRVVGAADSKVFLSLSPHGRQGLIEVNGERFILSSGPHGAGADTVMYSLDDTGPTMEWAEFRCGLDGVAGGNGGVGIHEGFDAGAGIDFDARGHSGGSDGGVIQGEPPCRVAEMAVESDYEYTRDLFQGNTDASAAYATTLIAAISEIYTDNLNAHLSISFLRVWASDNDPYSGGSAYDRLFQFQDHWNDNMGHVDRHLAHFLSALRSDVGGVAWLEGLCDGSYGYALSSYLNGYFPYPLQHNHEQNWDLMVVAHETGHNFGAPHTHDIGIDNCAGGDCNIGGRGTIMSYCHTCPGGMTNIRLEFHPRMINEEILPFLNRAGCDLTDHPDCQGGGVDCDAISAVIVKCKGGDRVSGKIKSSLAPGTTVTFTLNGGDAQTDTVNNQGRARVRWLGVAPGDYEVCVEECPGRCGDTSC